MKRHRAIGVVLLASCVICFALTNAHDVLLRVIGALAGVFGIIFCFSGGTRESRTRSSHNDASGGDGGHLIDGHAAHGNHGHGHGHDGGSHGGDGGGHGGDGGGGH
jgi:hypothetical protein